MYNSGNPVSGKKKKKENADFSGGSREGSQGAIEPPFGTKLLNCLLYASVFTRDEKKRRGNWKTRKAEMGTENWERSSEVIKLATDYRVY